MELAALDHISFIIVFFYLAHFRNHLVDAINGRLPNRYAYIWHRLVGIAVNGNNNL